MKRNCSPEEKKLKKYQWISRKRWEIAVLIILVICVGFDICSRPYCCQVLEDIFFIEKNEYTGIASMILVVWTFTMALVVFWMGKIEEQRYGIRIRDAFMKNISTGNSDFRLITMSIGIIVELLAVFLAALYNWEITLKAAAGLQILTMIYIFYVVCYGNSKAVILEQIVESSVEYIVENYKKGEGIHDFLARMIENTEYKNESEVNQLNDVIKKIAVLAEERMPDEKMLEKNLCLQWYMKTCMDNIIYVCKDNNTAEIIMKNLMIDLSSVYAKKGIFLSAIDNDFQKGAPDALKMINIDFEDRNLVLAAGFAYCKYNSISEDYYRYLADKLQICIRDSLRDENIEVIETVKDMWIELTKEREQKKESGSQRWNVKSLWEMVFPEGGSGKWKEI